MQYNLINSGSDRIYPPPISEAAVILFKFINSLILSLNCYTNMLIFSY